MHSGSRRSLKAKLSKVCGWHQRQETKPWPSFDSCNSVVKSEHSVSLGGSQLKRIKPPSWTSNKDLHEWLQMAWTLQSSKRKINTPSLSLTHTHTHSHLSTGYLQQSQFEGHKLGLHLQHVASAFPLNHSFSLSLSFWVFLHIHASKRCSW